MVYEEAGDQIDKTQLDEPYVEETGLADAIIPLPTARFEPKVVEMDDLMTSFRKLAVELPHTVSAETVDEQGVPKDYGENGAIDMGAIEEHVLSTRAQGSPKSGPDEYVQKRQRDCSTTHWEL